MRLIVVVVVVVVVALFATFVFAAITVKSVVFIVFVLGLVVTAQCKTVVAVDCTIMFKVPAFTS
jgi:hypothetical protein